MQDSPSGEGDSLTSTDDTFTLLLVPARHCGDGKPVPCFQKAYIMNKSTARRLDSLLALSAPVTLSENCVPSGSVLREYNGQPSAVAKSLHVAIAAIIARNTPACVAVEIQDAARERRQCDTTDPEFSPHDWAKRTEIPWSFTRKIWEYSRAEIQSVIDCDNRRRAAEYETYRIACEQGVAVPPAAEVDAE